MIISIKCSDAKLKKKHVAGKEENSVMNFKYTEK